MMITDAQFLALYPLYSLALQRAKNRNSDFDWSMSRMDYMDGKNGIPTHVGMKCVMQLLMMEGDLVHMSKDGQRFWITEKGAYAVIEKGKADEMKPLDAEARNAIFSDVESLYES